MRNLRILVVFGLIGPALFFAGCDTGDSNDRMSKPMILQVGDLAVAQIADGVTTRTISDLEARKLFTREFDLEPEQASALSYRVDSEAAVKYFIARTKTIDGTNCFSMALPLSTQGEAKPLSSVKTNTPAKTNTDDQVDDEKHSCTGDPCESCSFVKDYDTGEITGCDCNEWPGTCNHTIST